MTSTDGGETDRALVTVDAVIDLLLSVAVLLPVLAAMIVTCDRDGVRWLNQCIKMDLARWSPWTEWVNLGAWKRETGVTVDGYPFGDKYR